MSPEQLLQLTQNYLLPSAPGRTLLWKFEAHSNNELGPQELLRILEANPAYAHSILKQKILAQKIVQWTEEDPKRANQLPFLMKRVVSLLGKDSIRNLIVSFRLARMTGAGLPRKKDESISLEPSKQLSFAIATEELCHERKWVFPEMGFVGGLHYDWLTALLAYRKAPDETKKILKDTYAEGLQVAQYAYRISQQMKGIEHHHFVFAGALVLPLGKILMAVLFPKGKQAVWSSTMADCEKYGPARWDASDFFEKKLFQVTYPELTALYVQAFQLLEPVGPAIRSALEPWRLLGGDRDQHQFAMILSIATTLFRAGDLLPNEDLPIRSFQRKWLKESGVKERILQKSLMNLKEST